MLGRKARLGTWTGSSGARSQADPTVCSIRPKPLHTTTISSSLNLLLNSAVRLGRLSPSVGLRACIVLAYCLVMVSTSPMVSIGGHFAGVRHDSCIEGRGKRPTLLHLLSRCYGNKGRVLGVLAGASVMYGRRGDAVHAVPLLLASHQGLGHLNFV